MDGILLINKPKGYTSHDVVNVIRKKANIKKVGHTGTLDPNATGVLPILVGQATKISKYLIEHDKTYIAELRLGEKSDTGDIEGNITEKKDVPNLNKSKIIEVFSSFMGKQEQIPPKYSAVKINGKKAYEYARENKDIQLKPREVEIKDLELIDFTDNIITFKVFCSKGTYIRVLAEDIANKLGTVGLLQNLTRTSVDRFNIKDSFELEEIEEDFNDKIIPIEKILDNLDKINIDDMELHYFLNGVKIQKYFDDGVYRIYNSINRFVGTGTIEKGLLKRDVVLTFNN